MRLKFIFTITLLLALVAAVLILLEHRTEPIDPSDQYPRPLIADPQVFEKTTRLVIQGSEPGSRPLTIARDGRRWRLEDHHAIPVQHSVMQRLSRQLGEARLIRFVTQSPEQIKRLNIGKQSLRMLEKDQELVHIRLGESASQEGQPVSLDGERADLLRTPLEWSTDPADWWESRVLYPLRETDIRAFSLTWPDGSTLHAERTSMEAPFATSGKETKGDFDAEKARRLVRNFLSARIEGSHDRDASLVRAASDAPFILQLETFFDSTAELQLMRSPSRDEVVNPAEKEAPNDELAAFFESITPEETKQEPTLQRIPPGPVLALYQGDALEEEWKIPTEKAAFVLRDSIWNQIPERVNSFFTPGE